MIGGKNNEIVKSVGMDPTYFNLGAQAKEPSLSLQDRILWKRSLASYLVYDKVVTLIFILNL